MTMSPIGQPPQRPPRVFKPSNAQISSKLAFLTTKPSEGRKRGFYPVAIGANREMRQIANFQLNGVPARPTPPYPKKTTSGHANDGDAKVRGLQGQFFSSTASRSPVVAKRTPPPPPPRRGPVSSSSVQRPQGVLRPAQLQGALRRGQASPLQPSRVKNLSLVSPINYHLREFTETNKTFLQAANAYLDALNALKRSDIPYENKDLLNRYITHLDHFVKQAQPLAEELEKAGQNAKNWTIGDVLKILEQAERLRPYHEPLIRDQTAMEAFAEPLAKLKAQSPSLIYNRSLHHSNIFMQRVTRDKMTLQEAQVKAKETEDPGITRLKGAATKAQNFVMRVNETRREGEISASIEKINDNSKKASIKNTKLEEKLALIGDAFSEFKKVTEPDIIQQRSARIEELRAKERENRSVGRDDLAAVNSEDAEKEERDRDNLLKTQRRVLDKTSLALIQMGEEFASIYPQQKSLKERQESAKLIFETAQHLYEINPKDSRELMSKTLSIEFTNYNTQLAELRNKINSSRTNTATREKLIQEFNAIKDRGDDLLKKYPVEITRSMHLFKMQKKF